MHDCPICRAKQMRIDELEERLERLQQLVDTGGDLPPYEWSLGEQETVLARKLAKGPASADALAASLEAHCPSEEGRDASHIRVVLYRLRRKVNEYGWLIEHAKCGTRQYRILPEQQEKFADAVSGRGSHAYPAIVKGDST